MKRLSASATSPQHAMPPLLEHVSPTTADHLAPSSSTAKFPSSAFLTLALLMVIFAACQGRIPNNDAGDPPDATIPAHVLKPYLASHMVEPSFGGTVFCAYESLATEHDGSAVIDYLWVLCQEFYCAGEQLELGTGISLPVAVRGNLQDDNTRLCPCRRDHLHRRQRLWLRRLDQGAA
jgi:hypothetical protein